MSKRNNVDYSNNITVLSLCTGYGGLELGLSGALENLLRIVTVEIEAYALANLVAKTEEGRLAVEALYPDLRTFEGERFRGCFDFILAGYPCQPFSAAGRRQGADDERHLWPHIARIVQAVQPVWCFFENVANHLNKGFPTVYASLRDMGYAVEAGLFTASEVGAPHKRKRLFILAHTEHPGTWQGIEQKTQTGIGRDRSAIGGDGGTLWPARPGQPQYEWEEPRVVEYSRKGGGIQSQKKESGENAERRTGNTSERQAQSGVGRTVNGPACRVDRLRLLGNGVVPQQAELAFRALYKQIINYQ